MTLFYAAIYVVKLILNRSQRSKLLYEKSRFSGCNLTSFLTLALKKPVTPYVGYQVGRNSLVADHIDSTATSAYVGCLIPYFDFSQNNSNCKRLRFWYSVDTPESILIPLFGFGRQLLERLVTPAQIQIGTQNRPISNCPSIQLSWKLVETSKVGAAASTQKNRFWVESLLILLVSTLIKKLVILTN